MEIEQNNMTKKGPFGPQNVRKSRRAKMGLPVASLIALLWPDASQDSDSDIARLLRLGQAPHSGV